MQSKGNFLVLCLAPTLQKTLIFDAVYQGRVNRARLNRLDASGKGVNVCRVLTQLGCKAGHLTIAGGRFAQAFRELCTQDGLDLHTVESGSDIRFCYTVIDKKTNAVTELVEEAPPVEAGTEERLLTAYQTLLPEASTLIFSGSRAGGFGPELYPRMVKTALSEGNKRIVLDIRGPELVACMRAGNTERMLIKPNLYEFCQTFAPDLVRANDVVDDEALVKRRVAESCLSLTQDQEFPYKGDIVLTRGSKNTWYWDKESGQIAESPVKPLERALNTIGCGDAFTAGLAAALDGGKSLPEAIARGSHCGAQNAATLKPGSLI
jgi:1-phosphofructokinase/tagatose 6-phosphate kinase